MLSLISIVLPIHNQADHVESVVTRYEAALAGVDGQHELVLVLNACRDRSPEICEQLARRYDTVRLIQTERGGWGLAVTLGLANATGDLLCFTNSSRTSPEELSLVVATAFANPSAVIKARREVRESLARRVGSFLYNLECRALLDSPYWDVNGTPKAFPRTFAPLLQLTRDDDLLDAEFGAIVARERYPIVEVPIRSTRRHGGRSTTNYHSAWAMYVGAYQLARAMRRARS